MSTYNNSENRLTSPFVKLFLFLSLILGSILVASLSLSPIANLFGVQDLAVLLEELSKGNFTEKRGVARALVLMNQLFTFMIPALCFYFLYKRSVQGRDFYFLRRGTSWWIWPAAIGLSIVVFPFMQMLYQVAQTLLKVDLTELQERQQAILHMDGPLDLVIGLFLVGLVAGVGEELLFRGGLQRILAQVSGNVHVGIWSTAFIFSLIHNELVGFLPRLLLGLMLGYFVLWSGSLWVSIVVHVFHNSWQVVVMYISRNEARQGDIMELQNTTTILWSVALFSLGLSLLLFYIFYKRTARQGVQITSYEYLEKDLSQ